MSDTLPTPQNPGSERFEDTMAVEGSADAPAVVAAPETDAPANALPFPIVGIGASAGGVEALMEVFSHLPTDTGMAFVIVPHLAPDQKSHMVEILARKTEMPVSEILDNSTPEANHVYILPPNSFVTLSAGVLKLHSRSEDKRAPMPIDHFFRSLGAEHKNQAVGVVLSGTDSDGALGLKAIKGEGGITIVQHPGSARFPEMPRSSIAADHVDLVVPPPEIAGELAQLASRFHEPEVRPLQEGAPTSTDGQFVRVLNMLRTVGGINFRLYKPTTLRRRVARRMILNKASGLPQYLKYLQTHPEELRELHEDALINVTQFFRDPDVFQVFKSDILPTMLADWPSDRQLRIWVPGCSSGEEVYSIAMCLLEYLTGQPGEPPIQIFGTDASERSIERARLGTYPESITAEVSPERLRRFFIRVDKGFQVSKRLRDLCIFARQNLCNDPPFSKLDFISCRNVLIYFGQSLQRQLIQTFNYALRPNGYLLLGMTETIRNSTDLFTLMERKSKFYVKAGSTTVASFAPPEPLHHHGHPGHHTGSSSIATRVERWTEAELQRAVDRLILSRVGPPALVVNETLEILQFRGYTGRFLDIPSGPASFQLLHVLNDTIASVVRDAVQQALERDAPVRVHDVLLVKGLETERVSIEVIPVPSIPARPRCLAILFFPSQPAAQAAPAAGAPQLVQTEESNRLITQLQQDLSSTKLYLQSLIEDRDAKNQELISANEEIQSANEELQSTNEELETTKEELQSANEELQTTNEELQQRNAALAQTTNDFSNLFTSVNIPVLMLNNQLEIRSYTPLTQRLMNIRASDIGRSISEIRLNLSLENIEPILREVLETLGTREIEVQDREGRWHQLRIRPYRTSENKIEGVVLVLVDVDQLRKSRQELKDARDFANAVMENVSIPIVVLNKDLRIRTANSAFRELTGIRPENLDTRSFPELVELLWNMQSMRPTLEELRKQGLAGPGLDTEHEVTTPEYRVFQTRGRIVQINNEEVILLTLEEITARKQAEKIVQREKEQLEGTVRSTAQALGQTREELRALSASLFRAQEEERRRVARELHDDISQRLAVLGIDLQQLSQSVPRDADINKVIDGLASRTSSLAEDLRKISHGLHPAILDDLGLSYALKALADEFSEREKMVVTLQRQNVPEHIPQDVAAALYRITQEALHNVTKHAGKTHVKIILEGTQTGVRLEVADFGEGFDMESANHGLGLISMSERAHLVNGTLSVRSALAKGTTVTVNVPVPQNKELEMGHAE